MVIKNTIEKLWTLKINHGKLLKLLKQFSEASMDHGNIKIILEKLREFHSGIWLETLLQH